MAAGLAGVEALVAPTEAMRRELEYDHELAPGATIVIHNGSSAPLAPPRTEKRELVMGAGRLWDPAKNLAMLDAAAEGLSWPVVVAGDLGPDGGTEHAESTGLLDPSALGELRRGASIYAAPAVYEPFGLGILEAARDRCALVLGYIPSLRELWGGAAVFVEPRDERALHDALEKVSSDRLLREELAERALERATVYSIARTAEAYRGLYQQLVACGEEVRVTEKRLKTL
jgi:glycogen(starch) synthase